MSNPEFRQPQFRRDDDYYYTSLVTGPTHVLLGLAFAEETQDEMLFERRPAVWDCEHGVLDEVQIGTAVRKGVAEASAELGKPLSPIVVAYVENDTRNYGLFARAAYLIAKQFISGGEFARGNTRERF